jgi:hypothetical protein
MVHYALCLSLVVPLLCFATAVAVATCRSVVSFLFLIELSHTRNDDLQGPFVMKTRISKYGVMLVM